jgi:hypothetical protein
VFYQELQSYIFKGPPSQVFEPAVLPAQMDLFLLWLGSAGQPMCSQVDSCQAFFLQKVNLVGRGSKLRELEWSSLFAPSSLELGEPVDKWREAGLMVLTIEPCPMPSPKRSF